MSIVNKSPSNPALLDKTKYPPKQKKSKEYAEECCNCNIIHFQVESYLQQNISLYLKLAFCTNYLDLVTKQSQVAW